MDDFSPEILSYRGALDWPNKRPCWFSHDWLAVVEGAGRGRLRRVTRCRKCGSRKPPA